MSDISVHQNPTILDPELLALGRHVVAEMALAAGKAAAHLADPGEFPISEDAALEKLFLERLRVLPSDRQNRASKRALELLRGPVEGRKALFGALADVDVREARPVSHIVRERPVPRVHATADKLAQALSTGADRSTLPIKRLRPRDATEWLEMRLHHVSCLDETDGFLNSEAGSDEMSLGVIFIDPILRTTKSPTYDLGSYESDGVERSFPPLVLGGWDLRVGFYWPRKVSAIVYLSEIDNGGFPEWMQKVLEFAKSKLSSAITAAVGAAIGGLLGAGLGALVGALVGWVVGELISALKTIWEDDVFVPATFTFDFASAGATWGGQLTSPKLYQVYAGHGGMYELTFDLRLTTYPTGQKASGLVTGVLDDVVTDLAGVACCLTTEHRSTMTTFDPLRGDSVKLPTINMPIERPFVFALGRADGSMMVKDSLQPDATWTSIGGGFRSGPAVALTNPTRPVVFARGTDDALWHAWRDGPNVPFSGWYSLGGVITSAPAATMSGNRLVVAARGTDNAIYHKWYEGGWSDWHSLGGVSTSAPALVHHADNRLFAFCRGIDGAIYHKWYDGGWSDWHSLGGVSTSAPAAMVDAGGRLVVFCRGTDGAIHHRWHDGQWSDWHSLGNLAYSAPASMVGPKKQSTVLCRAADGAIHERHWVDGWTPWTSLGVP